MYSPVLNSSRALAVALSLVASSLASQQPAAAAAPPAAPPNTSPVTLKSALGEYRLVTLVTGLENPWSLAFLPNGDMLVTERPGRLRIVRKGKLLADPVPGVPAVRAGGQGGLLDVVLHPQFATNRLVYLAYAKPNEDGTQGATAVSRGRFENDRLEGVEEIFVAKNWATGRGHYGSRLVFDRDGYLFISVSDRQAPPSGELERHPAQDLTKGHGKIVRLHDDGRVPADNPFVGKVDTLPEIWSYGHRSVQGLALHPETGELWETEHGPQGGDEFNRIEKGKNYGWPVVGFGVNYGSGRAIHAATIKEGMEPAKNIWVPSIATAGFIFYTGDRFPQWKGNVFVGGMVGEQLARLTLDGARVTSEETLVQRQGRIRDVRQGADGYIYLVFDNAGEGKRSIARLEPVATRR